MAADCGLAVALTLAVVIDEGNESAGVNTEAKQRQKKRVVAV
jgi:hypothetical protein